MTASPRTLRHGVAIGLRHVAYIAIAFVFVFSRVRKLADQIIESQRKEIDEMKALIEELKQR